jgi:hypothetical protein
VVIGTSPGEKFWRKEIAREVKPLEERVEFIWWDNLSFEDILKEAAKLPSNSAIFWEKPSRSMRRVSCTRGIGKDIRGRKCPHLFS